MTAKKRIPVDMSSREWRRHFFTGVVKSLAKTVTEPITNSDSSYKRLLALPDSSGLVEAALSLKKGDRFDLTLAKAALKDKAPQRRVEIHLYTASGHGRNARTLEIVDFAEGMSIAEVERAFSEYAADKSDVSKGRPGRSLFGRGVSDVLFGHRAGRFYSHKDGTLTVAEFSFDSGSKSKPEFEIEVFKRPTLSQLRDCHLVRESNGTCVRVELADECRIPEEGNLVPLLSQFYMLRLINADPNVAVKLVRYRSKKEVFQDILDFDFPVGDVVEKFEFMVRDPIPGHALREVRVEGIVARSDSKAGLPGKELGELRANGLLFVDEKDAVLDQTLLPDFDNVPYLKGIFGVVRISNVRSVFEWYLNSGKDSVLTVSRDGFETRHEFTKLLFSEIGKRIEGVYRREEARYAKRQDVPLSARAQKQMTDVVKVLNQFLENSGEGDGTLGKRPEEQLDPNKLIQFLPDKIRLLVATPRKIQLFVKKATAQKVKEIVVQSSNPSIEITPTSFRLDHGREFGQYVIVDISVKCDVLHADGQLDALAEDSDGNFIEAKSTVVDVIAQPIIDPPLDIAFRPDSAYGSPSRKNNLILWINPASIPLGRKIKIVLEKNHGKIVLLAEMKEAAQVEVVFDKAHLIKNANVGRILIPWRGTGWGQWAKVVAETKKPDGSIVRAEARLDIEQTEEDAGVVRKWEYEPLENRVCSQFADGVIYINSSHNLNTVVFGQGKPDFIKSTESDRTAQYRLAHLVVEQAVYRRAEDMYIEDKIMLNEKAPVTQMREVIDKLTHELSPKVTKILIG